MTPTTDFQDRILSGHLCECGCGRQTYYAEVTVNKRNHIKGYILKFYPGHSSRGTSPPAGIPENMSWCCDCKSIKCKTEFYKNKTLKSGIHSYCKSCCRARTAIERAKGEIRSYKKYGLSTKLYLEMCDNQKHVCKICNKTENYKNSGKICRLSVDHCHKTNKIRGLLCKKCNSVLGLAGDNIQTLKNAITYLESNT